MEFEVVLVATTRDEGGMKVSFDRQVAEIGGEPTLLEEYQPYAVESSDGRYFEAKRKYKFVL